MKIAGLQKTTLLDYPGRVAATIFLPGCNMRCPFCHNMDIVTGELSSSEISEDAVFQFLNKRKGILEGVCITGGEPTLYPDLPDLIRNIKNIGYSIKLDTNGTNPSMIEQLYGQGLIDYVAMDIKSDIATYEKCCGISGIDTSLITRSIDYLIHSGIDYEFRTTLVSQFHTREVMEGIGEMINGAQKYFLQSFIDSDFVPDHDLCPPSLAELKEFEGLMKNYVSEVHLRGIDE